MTTHTAKSTFNVASWTETLISDIDGTGTTAGDAYYPSRGITRVDATYAFAGDLEGTATIASLITYKEGPAPVLGFTRFEGSIGGHEGTLVFCEIGTQDAGSVSTELKIVAGMGTGGLENMTGTATIDLSGHSEDGYDFVLEYEL